MREFDYYFFDLFNTLIKLEPYEQESRREYRLLGISKEAWDENSQFNYENRARGRITSPEKIVTDLVKNCRPDAPPEIINAVLDVRKERFLRAMVKIDPDIFRTIQELHKRNKKITLISNADAFDTLFWHDSPLFSFFDETVFSCDTGLMKPDAAIYDFAVRKTGADNRSSVFIGDGGFNELEGAKKAGITSILTTQIIKDLWPEEIPAFASQADYVIENFTELLF